MDTTEQLLDGLPKITGWHQEFYEDLHRHPELSFQETRTASRVADRLRELGFEVHEKIGATGLVGILRNGAGKTVLSRADMDALPVHEETGLPYASTATTVDTDGKTVPLMHACGHDMHVTCLLAAAALLSGNREAWSGTFVALFQPAEEVGAGAQSMVDGGLAGLIPKPDVALGQHVMGLPYDTVATRAGAIMSAGDSVKVTVYGKGTHGSMPHRGIDAVLLGSAIVMRLNAIVSRELQPGTFAVVTVGSFQSGSKSNVIPGEATLLLNLRSYEQATRARVMAALERIVRAECEASGSPKPPVIEYYDQFPLTENSANVHARVAAAFGHYFGDKAVTAEPETASEDFSVVPVALGVPYQFWFFGGFDPQLYASAAEAGTLAQVIPPNHNGHFAPVFGPSFATGAKAMAVAVMSYLGR